jgi:hypothetical protein
MSPDFQPDRTFHIVQHTEFTKTIKVLDLTNLMTATYGTTSFKEEAKQLAKNPSSIGPCLIIVRANFFGTWNVVKQPPSEAQVAEWNVPFFPPGTSRITFPADSPHASHPLTMKPLAQSSRGQKFVQDSVTYKWVMDSKLHSGEFTLYKYIGPGEEGKLEVAKYWKRGGFKGTGGTMVLDSTEVDEVVGIMACLTVLKRNRRENRR